MNLTTIDRVNGVLVDVNADDLDLTRGEHCCRWKTDIAQTDDRDAFEEGFFYDKITGTASITRGILRTDNLLIDGLLADIALRGDMNLYRRTINMDAVIAPELGAGLSVATAFMVNPVAGLAVFAASQALSPLWSKLSLLRYHIEGSMDNPQVQETQRIEKGDF